MQCLYLHRWRHLLWHITHILGRPVQDHSCTDCRGPDPLQGDGPLPHSLVLGLSFLSQGGHPKLLIIIFCELLKLKEFEITWGLHYRSLKQSYSSVRLRICGLCPGGFWPKRSLGCAWSLLWKTWHLYRKQFWELPPETHSGFIKATD